jgi:uncharacterized RDD family membrane protein YckC
MLARLINANGVDMPDHNNHLQYAGFWSRVAATMVDTILTLVVTLPLLMAIYGDGYFAPPASFLGFVGFWDFIISLVLPAAATIAFWLCRGATPGKMALRLQVVDADTGQRLTPAQSFVRYLSYFVSLIPLCLGLLWVAFDEKNKGGMTSWRAQ